MAPHVIEIAKIRLASDIDEAELIAASDRFQNEFLVEQPGYLGRDLVRLAPGRYADIIRWTGPDAAEAILPKLSKSPACRDYFSIMDTEESLSRHPVLSSHPG